MPDTVLRIATRKSPLALWQAEYVKQRLEQSHPQLQVELLTMTTQGDKILDTPLAKVGGKGLFVKELELSMLEGRADIAVHSMKDVPVELPDGLHLPVICEREDPRDAFVSNAFVRIDELPQGARVGTSSLRRSCQLRAYRPDLEILDLRGNVGTRLQKLDDGNYEAIILAAAGLRRLGLSARIRDAISSDVLLPAIGQGAVGIECRQDDTRVNDIIAVLDDKETHIRVAAERALNQRLEGGCQVPIAGYAELENDALRLRGLVGWPDGRRIIHDSVSGKAEDATLLGVTLGERLLEQGAGEILQALYSE